MLRAVFLDRDGVINRAVVRDGKPYPPASLAEFEILPGVPEALRELDEAGFLLIVVTNQPDVARGSHVKWSRRCTSDSGRSFRWTILRSVTKSRAQAAPATSRKPGMLLEAAREHHIDLARSYMVGDRWRDVGAGRAAGYFTIFIDRGYAEGLPETPDATLRRSRASCCLRSSSCSLVGSAEEGADGYIE